MHFVHCGHINRYCNVGRSKFKPVPHIPVAPDAQLIVYIAVILIFLKQSKALRHDLQYFVMSIWSRSLRVKRDAHNATRTSLYCAESFLIQIKHWSSIFLFFGHWVEEIPSVKL